MGHWAWVNGDQKTRERGDKEDSPPSPPSPNAQFPMPKHMPYALCPNIYNEGGRSLATRPP
ncbi:MAG: hypothetical protein F6J93_33855 [Oscillatoria sp. SIO1A7]|nr:hypothetical protein [Oscillatoria sp. SIO1A7]